VRQSQPIGFLGCLEAIKAPTSGKTKNRLPRNSLPTLRSAPQPRGTCADRASKQSRTLAPYMAPLRPASDHASHAEVLVLTLAPPRPCSLLPTVTTPLYKTTVSQALRQTLRGGLVRKPAEQFFERAKKRTASALSGRCGDNHTCDVRTLRRCSRVP
jgi:hypothetical protein